MYISKYQFNKVYNKGIRKIFKIIFLYKMKKNNYKYILGMKNEYGYVLDNVCGCVLDKIQREIVLSEEKYALVIAGAGSGKSLTIIGRILYLLEKGISLNDILVISFTNEACNNLRKKIANLNVVTFHKLGRDILKKNGYMVKLVNDNTLDNIIDFVLSNSTYEKKFYGEKKEILKKLLSTFINLFKGSGYSEEDFDRFLNINNSDKEYLKEKNKIVLLLAREVYIRYESFLYQNGCIDFHDMISKSIEVIDERGIYPYKYVIVDEYQDTSIIKCKLVQVIINKTEASLLTVGDDFQSIYRFSGSNLKIFTEFERYFKGARIFKMEKTYRNSSELLNITHKFILKNKNQIYKKVISDKHCLKPIYIYYYEDEYVTLVNRLIEELGDVLVLGRNNKDLQGINGRCMTVHKSKGLEAENVIIVNLEDNILGFPNRIIYDDVLKYVLDFKEHYPFEEERRLFYVALTRTKNVNYLLVNRNNPSPFVLEILENEGVIIMNG